MGNNRPIKTKCWIKYLESLGFEMKRSKGSHFQYVKVGYRSIPVREADKQVPAHHLRCSCRTLDITIHEVYDWVDKNC